MKKSTELKKVWDDVILFHTFVQAQFGTQTQTKKRVQGVP